MRAVEAVFNSWNAPRAIVYRRQYGIGADAGTAANVMQMVFGNRDARSATGVCFSRDPATGRPGLYGEFLVQAQGEDVVAGTRTPEPIARMRQVMPAAYAELDTAVALLENHYRDVQDVEFTVESGRLYVLQTRGAKRTVTAALRAAVDMAAEGLISRADAVKRIDPGQLEQLLHPMIDPTVQTRRRSDGAQRLPRRSVRPRGLRRRLRRGARRCGPERDPRPAGDDRRRHPRTAPRRAASSPHAEA